MHRFLIIGHHRVIDECPCVSVCVCVCVFCVTHIHTQTDTQQHTYTRHANAHTHIHTDTHTYIFTVNMYVCVWSKKSFNTDYYPETSISRCNSPVSLHASHPLQCTLLSTCALILFEPVVSQLLFRKRPPNPCTIL